MNRLPGIYYPFCPNYPRIRALPILAVVQGREHWSWLNIIRFALTTIMFMLAPDLLYKTQSWIFPISRETFNVVFYSFLAVYKITIIVFNVVPLIALLIVSKKGK